jgi:hypothetical protein
MILIFGSRTSEYTKNAKEVEKIVKEFLKKK